MSLGGVAGSIALQRQVQRQQEKFRERQDRTRERMGQRKKGQLSWATAAEPMACPGCGVRYPFGDTCPECELELVGAAFVDLAEPTKRPLVHSPVSAEQICGRCLKPAVGGSCVDCGTRDILDPSSPADVSYLNTLATMRQARKRRLVELGLFGMLGSITMMFLLFMSSSSVGALMLLLTMVIGSWRMWAMMAD